MALLTRKAGDGFAATSAARGGAGRPKRRTLQPPLTPMIDVTFQLLLFFLLTCEFRESEGNIPGSLPAIGPSSGATPVKITLKPSGVGRSAYYEINGVAGMISSPRELYVRLKRRQAALGTTDVPVVIHPQPNVPWEFVVEAFNQAVRAKFEKIGFPRDSLTRTSRT